MGFLILFYIYEHEPAATFAAQSPALNITKHAVNKLPIAQSQQERLPQVAV